MIDAFYSASSLTGLNRPQVYRLTADASNVDIRYDLAGFRPKAAILTDGGNQNIHLAYLTAASIPSVSYATSQGTDLLTNCFTFASEPHNANTGAAVNNAISAIKDFVSKGGNFLAQCEAINNYENNSLGRFQTTGGITISNSNIGTSLNYAHPDLSFSQYEGNYNASIGGSIKNWKVVGTTTNNEQDHATGISTNTTVIGASVSKHYYDKGGLVFYIGNHSFATSTLEGINGIRMYMNAFLTPSNSNCPELLFTPLALKLTQFSGNNQSNKTKLFWTVSNNELVKEFVMERSKDEVNFNSISTVTPSASSGSVSYQYSAFQKAAKSFYRLKIIDKQGKIQYSSILSFLVQSGMKPYLSILSSNSKDDLLVGYYSHKNDIISVHLYNLSGSTIYSNKIKIIEGMNIVRIPEAILRRNGIYLVVTVNQNYDVLQMKVPKFD